MSTVSKQFKKPLPFFLYHIISGPIILQSKQELTPWYLSYFSFYFNQGLSMQPRLALTSVQSSCTGRLSDTDMYCHASLPRSLFLCCLSMAPSVGSSVLAHSTLLLLNTELHFQSAPLPTTLSFPSILDFCLISKCFLQGWSGDSLCK